MNVLRNSGMTVSELVLAMAITSVIALSVAGASMVMSQAVAHNDQAYEHRHAATMALSRISGVVRQSLLVTAAEDDRLVLWQQDANEDQAINLGELTVVEFDSANKTIILRRLGLDNLTDGMRATLDVGKTLTWATSGESVTGAIESNIYGEATVLAEDVQQFHVSLDGPATAAKLVKLTIIVGEGKSATQASGAATLRADKTANVTTDDQGQLVLLADH